MSIDPYGFEPQVEPAPSFPMEEVLRLIRQGQPGPFPQQAPPGFLDRLGAGLANVQAPGGGHAGDVFGANLLAGFGRSFGGNRVAARNQGLERQMAEYEAGKAQKAAETQAQIMGLTKTYEAGAGRAKESREASREFQKDKREAAAKVTAAAAAVKPGVVITPGMAKRYVRLRGLEGQELTRATYEDVVTAKADKPDKPEKERLVEIMGPDGKVIWVRESDAVGKQKGGGLEVKPPTAGERDKMTDDATALGQAGDLRQLYRKEFVGPATGRLQGLASQIGAPAGLLGIKLRPGEADFRGALAQYRNRVINALSGAAVSESEAKRMAQQIPQETDPSETFEAKLRQTEKNLRNVASTRRETATSTGVDLSGLAPLPEAGRVRLVRGPNGQLMRQQ